MSESVNSMFKKDLGNGYLTMRKIFQGLNLFLKTARDNELESDFKSRQTSPYLAISHSPILKHAASIYTPKMFMHFQKQFDAEHGVRLSTNALINEIHERIAYQDGLTYKIKYNPTDATIFCSCCMYETHGYLCAHVLRVFNISDVNQIPEKYIMKRWTREAKTGLESEIFSTSELNSQEIRTALCSEFNRLVYRVGSNKYFANGIRRLIQEGHVFIDDGEKGEADNGNEVADAEKNSTNDKLFLGVTGVKIRENKKRGPKRRAWSCFENKNGPAKKKKNNKKNVQQENNLSNGVGTCKDYINLDVQTPYGLQPNITFQEKNNVYNGDDTYTDCLNFGTQTSGSYGLPPNIDYRFGNF